MAEQCSWCRTRTATRYHCWTQKPDGTGQQYAYCSCEQCFAKQDNRWFEKCQVSRDEWLVARMFAE